MSKEEQKIDKSKKIDIKLKPGEGVFDVIFKPFKISPEKSIDLEKISSLRSLLSNEKAKILHVLKEKKPSSIYELAKILDRDFKSVKTDLDVLKKFDFITFTKQQKGKRASLKPELKIEKIDISIEL
ncbi:hypothetical protein AUJ10_01980 [Candidatus Pacearchaeota archaeon CG1_02_31_27]|nr:MAG: hypothetical protein AUJ10_01980 [Candidatus Pacearchaeota archaeon CG1_02_31_27]PIN92562.1 MAG: hypothetical protein COU55_00020 [Candidatus Pacearchaeota archaeon CG10_big_fil_rev_8_21_14_0_10_31_59]PIZ80885.1 MAG: hypothetical protein COX99_01430 [Candidatus Pacearchaeota archaeon CG_4_10_14_0_2_um_filter_31_10]